jgi:N-acetylglucosaminylphosphatidylinositol deacetylase
LIFKYLPVVSWVLLAVSMFSSSAPTASTTIPGDTNNIRIYRLNKPSLNWKVMAAHQSQFVWYRRLFVVFSCYTYCNKLKLISRSRKKN